MSANAPSSSKHMSVEDEAREKNKTFWAMSQQLDEREADELARAGDGDYEVEEEEETTSTDGGEHTDGGVGEHTTTDGGEQTDGGAGGSNRTAKKQKKVRKDRTPQGLANITEEFTLVSRSGQPLEPKEIARGYGMQLGCMLRETVSINTHNLRSKENEALVQNLLMKLHERYTFPKPLNKKVESLAITKMSDALSSWKSRVKKKIDKGLSWEEIHAKEPMLDEEEFETFKASLETEEAKAWTKWGKDMRELNIGNHRLGSGGYFGKQPIWDKEDAEVAKLGKENPWHKITDEQVRNFVRSRYYLKPGTGEFVTDDKDVLEFEKVLVSNLITADISKSIASISTLVHP